LAFPATCTLTGTYNDATGAIAQGQLVITPTAELVDASGAVILPQIPITVPLINGTFTTPLLPTDTAGISPTGWSYQVVEEIAYSGRGTITTTYYIQPTGTGTINIASLAKGTTAPTVTTYGTLAGTNTWTGPNTFQGAVALNGTVTLGTPLPITQGGTGQTSQQTALNALAGGTTSGAYLRGNGTNVALSAIQAADLPTATTSTQGAVVLDGTAADIKAPGAQTAGSTGKAADSGHVHPTTGLLTGNQLSPADHGLIAWNFAPYNVRASDKIAMTAGTLYLAKLPIPYATTINKIGFYVAQAGTNLTTGQNYGALYGPTGSLLASTADLTATYGTAGGYLISLTSSQPVAAGYVYIGLYFNGTGTALAAGAGDAPTGLLNFNLTNAGSLFATANTGLTTAMPSSLGTLTPVTDGIWACIA
jgi:hypothetical protein